jgi:hypothetical protein
VQAIPLRNMTWVAWKKVPSGDPFAPEYGEDEQTRATASLIAASGFLVTIAVLAVVVMGSLAFWGATHWWA